MRYSGLKAQHDEEAIFEEPLRPVRPACGAILIGALLIVLVSTLYREASGKQ